MSKLITNTVRHVDGTADNITLDSSQNVTVEGNATVDGTSTLTGNVTCSGQLKADALRHTGASSDAVTLATDGTCTAKITNNLSNRNLVINGAMQCAQYGSSSTSTGYQTVDRFSPYHVNTDEAPTYAQHALTSSDTGPWAKGFRNSLHITNGNQTGGAGADDQISIDYRFEAQDIANSGWNYTSASSYITLSFWVKSSVAQAFQFHLKTEDGTEKQYPMATGSLSADTWTKITKTIPGHADLTFNNDTGKGFNITWFLYAGTNRTGSVTDNAWMTYSGSTKINDCTSTWYTTNDATFELTGVQLEVSDHATEFEMRSYGDELLKCKRYFSMHSNLGTNTALSDGFSWSANEVDFMYTFPVEMRATPSIYQVTGADYFKIQGSSLATYVDGNWTLQYASKFATSHYAASDSSRTAGTSMHITFNNAAARLGYSAEL